MAFETAEFFYSAADGKWLVRWMVDCWNEDCRSVASEQPWTMGL